MLVQRCKFTTTLYLVLGVVFLCSKEVSGQCSICGSEPLPDPTRTVIVEGAAVTTCEGLEAEAAADPSLCSGLTDFAFYCGCSATPACSLCGEGVTTMVEKADLELTGLEPSWFPSNEKYTCQIAQGIVSLITGGNAACKAERDQLESIQLYCGCLVPAEFNCTTVCPDGSLVAPEYRDVQLLTEHPLYSYQSFTCGELDLYAAFGLMWLDECDASSWGGIKKCGCPEPARSYCDLCEDGSTPSDLSTNITYQMTCYDYGGLGFFLDSADETCIAIQATAGVYCGCGNPTASAGACRICDVPGGLVVPDPNRTIVIDVGEEELYDCGELELIGSDPNPNTLTCDDVVLLSKENCCFDFTLEPEGTTPQPTPPQTAPPTAAPVAAATLSPTAKATPIPTAKPTSAPTLAPVGTAVPVSTTAPSSKPVAVTEQPTESVQGPPPETTPSPTAGPTSVVTGTPPTVTIQPSAASMVVVPGDGCTICGTGIGLPFPDLTIYQEGFDNVTCSDMELAATLDNGLCSDLAAFAFYCECPNAAPTCASCAGGGRIPDDYQDLVLNGMAPDWFPANENLTCGELERIISVADNSTQCSPDYEPFATLCGCSAPPDSNCTSLCPDGSIIDPIFSDFLVLQNHPALGTMTCAEFQLMVAAGDLSLAQCDSANYVGIKYCGCQETISFCDMCEDGSQPKFFEREITFAKTCLDHAGDGYLLAPDDALCPVFQATFGESCGCENPIASADTCRICDAVGGVGVPDSNYTITVNGGLVDCGVLEFLANSPGSNLTCEDATALGQECCDVTMAPTAAPERCTICRNGILPFPDRQIFGEGIENTTCGSLEANAIANETFCDGLAEYEFYCGCAETSSACPLCVVGNSTPKESLLLKGYAPTWFPAEANYTCGMEAQLRSLQSDCSSDTSELEKLSTLCGCSVPESSTCSSLCPDGTLIDPSFNNVMVIENNPEIGNVSCADYQLVAASGDLSAAECDAAHYVGIKICGCAETRPFCDICEDGAVPSDLTKEVTFGKTCLDHAGDAYFTDPNDAVCVAMQASYGEYCMCNNVLAGLDACRICPGGSAVPSSNYTVKIGDFSVDCGNLEFTGNDPGAAFTCAHVTAFGPECCGPTNQPTSGPTPSPTPVANARENVPVPTSVPDGNGALFTPTSGEGKKVSIMSMSSRGLISFAVLIRFADLLCVLF